MTLPDIVSRAQNDGLASLKLAELKQIATSQGLRGISGMRKGELVSAIASAGIGTGRPAGAQASAPAGAAKAPAKESASARAKEETAGPAGQDRNDRQDRAGRKEQQAPQSTADNVENVNNGKNADSSESAANTGNAEGRGSGEHDSNDRNDRPERNDRNDRNDRGEHGDEEGGRRGRRNRRNRRNRGKGDQGGNQENRENRGNQQNADDRGGRNRNDRGNRNNRGDRGDRGGNQGGQNNQNQNNGGGNNEPPTPVAGILDFADANTAFIRTTGYHAGSTDVYVPIQMVRKYGMRHGDAVTGTIRPGAKAQQAGGGGRGRNRQKYTPLHAVETVNGLAPDQAAQRPKFNNLTPLYPNQRLRLETEPKVLTTRVIDLIMPIGKGQRALIVSPPKAGKTTILQDIANAITVNNPECYLMVVLVDERPEEVTDMQRSVRGEVIASTFDRPPNEHTAVAELAIERAKRLVEQGKDVVVLLDSITRLGRAYNNSSPASGRILSGGVDSNALYPPKRFLGAARNIEDGGSLTIIATAMVETGSAGDTVIFEEFKGTGNAELKLDRKIAERRMFPAVDVNPSGTRKDDLLLGPDEARLMHKLRRILSALDPQAAIDLLLKQLRKSKTNRDFMLQIASSAPLAGEDDDE
ncbi:transcription termination factor Rho [Corynebacterium sp. CNJ-954]|uniref:transcription termination factor Rho n=1 Tax=Corynebacterium sp. CNJ-954 TaxID=1904962 RepID=UPI00095DF987|nr:transcription termination factor Rho [Corynebacterium sp. CNJ-954]OLT54935.1 transcription termination factor Rho [Corynebacterium sp. CNJ-954]